MTTSNGSDPPASASPSADHAQGATSPSPRASVEQLLDWLTGRLDTATARRVADAVAADDDVAATVTMLRRLVAASADLAAAEVPSALHDRLLALWDHHVQVRQSPVSRAVGALRVVAALRFDSWTARPLAATRGTDGPTDARQLLFTAPGADVVVDIAVTGGGVRLSGQVFSGKDGPPRRAVRLETRRGPVDRQTTDELGEFHFDAVPEEPVEIVLEGDDEIVLPLDMFDRDGKQT